jgi:hypothetical protein
MYILYHFEWTIILCATARLVSFDASRALTRKQEQDEILRFEVCGRGDRRGAQIGGLPRRVSWTLMQWSTSSASSSGRCCCCVGALPSPASQKIRPSTTAPRRCGGWFWQVVAPTGGAMATVRGGDYLVAADARARRQLRSPWWRRRLYHRE